MTQYDDINAVLGQVQPLGEDHPVAQDTFESVKAMLEQRGEELQQLSEIELTAGSTIDVGVIRPGDTVIFSTRDRITAQQADEMKQRINEMLPQIKPIILSGVRIEAVYREDDDA